MEWGVRREKSKGGVCRGKMRGLKMRVEETGQHFCAKIGEGRSVGEWIELKREIGESGDVGKVFFIVEE